MKLKIAREYLNDNVYELLFDIDKEFMDTYEKETGERITQEGFNKYINEKMKEILDGEEWQLKDWDS
tara:strand:+ start:130 stop:330 length:201 start_codon:yes stop_codon:yes gene_type:complete